MSEQPDFIIVCDHGIGGGPLDPVARLYWWPNRGDWWPAEGDEDAVELFEMNGTSQVDWQPFRRITDQDGKPLQEPTRRAIEIGCPAPRCSRRPYRSDTDKLQTLLALIATDDELRAATAVCATDTAITITLDALHAARGHAKQHYRLPV